MQFSITNFGQLENFNEAKKKMLPQFAIKLIRLLNNKFYDVLNCNFEKIYYGVELCYASIKCHL